MARNKIQFAVSVKDDASANLQRISKETDKLSGSFKRMAAAAVSIGTLTEIARLADVYRLLQNRLRLVTSETEELRAVTDELVTISLRSRTSFQATADLYARVARSSRTLGLSQQELLNFTETVSKSIRISGSTAQEAAAGVIQFGQALASSRLSGDELRSVLEQMPRLAQAIAEGMGVGIGQLREMGEAGELTAVRVLEALRKAAPEIAEEFSRLQPLVSEALTNINSALLVTIGLMDEMSGVSVIVADTLLDWAEQILLLGKAFTGTLEPADALGDTFKRIAIFALVAENAISTLKSGLDVSGGRIVESVGELIAATFAVLATIGDPVGGGLPSINDVLGERLGNIWDPKELAKERDEIISETADMMEKIGMIMNDFDRTIPNPFDLTKSGDPADDIGRKAREAMARSGKELDKFQTKLFNQADALKLVAKTGLEYGEALQIVKVRAIGAAAGNEELAENLITTFNVLNDASRISEANVALEELQDKLINEGVAFRIATQEGIKFSAALQMVDMRALGAAAGNEELAENLIRAFKVMNEQQEELVARLRFTENMARRAAENMQDAFAEFFFDPFEEGLKGLLLSFINVIRRMIAEAAALQVAQQFGFADIFAKLVIGTVTGGAGGIPGEAAGGPVIAGRPVLVGERGAEIFIPNADGSIRNNTAIKGTGGEMQFITNIDARGADPGLIARLPQIMDQRDRRLMVSVKRFFETGVLPL